MKTIKAHVCKYNVKTGKKEIVIEEIPVYPEPKPVPTPEQIKIKKLESKIKELQTTINSIISYLKEKDSNFNVEPIKTETVPSTKETTATPSSSPEEVIK